MIAVAASRCDLSQRDPSQRTSRLEASTLIGLDVPRFSAFGSAEVTFLPHRGKN